MGLVKGFWLIWLFIYWFFIEIKLVKNVCWVWIICLVGCERMCC